KGQSHWLIWGGVGASAVMSIVLLMGMLSSVPHDGKSLAFIDHWFTWIEAGDASVGGNSFFSVSAAAFIDPLTSVMLAVVCGVGVLITIFAAGYMKGEQGYWRFFAYLGLFLFSMTCLVMGDNLIMLYLGWEGVGLCSYALIGYYYDKPAAREAAKKAFLVNRIGDFGFALGIMACWYAFGTVSYYGEGVGTGTGLLEIVANGYANGSLTGVQQTFLDWIPFLLMLGAFGKSAQFPLYVWLPDAMEGPTPVSALIHAATMVTAGVYMIARCGPLFVGNEPAMITIAVVGSFTAFFAGSIALRQFDLKKVFAYSTVSQLGFMFVAVGVLAPVAGVFHLVTHAFFKALLFLSSGVVMHAMLGHLDMRKMSGLKTVLPKTRWLMLIGCLALAGLPPLSGFWSKDEIVVFAGPKSLLLNAMLLLTALMTAYYTFRLYFRVFEGPTLVPNTPAEGHHGHDHGDVLHAQDASDHAIASSSAVETGTVEESGVDKGAARGLSHGHGHGHDHGHHNHEPWIMIAPLILLAIGAFAAGVINLPFGGGAAHGLGHFLGASPSFQDSYNAASAVYTTNRPDPIGFGQPGEAVPHWGPMIIGTLVAAAGIFLAFVLHLRDRAKAEQLAAAVAPVANAMENKYWIDELYDAIIVRPLRLSGQIFFAIDRYIVDGLVWLVGFVPQIGGFALKISTQRGYLQGYAVTMLLGIAAILLLVFL
ncbi:MAG TPA: NADH-quinone oxidoreductase subunit L, partial [Tepidisphaeraceae bacterium]|nr:NADH-quinone oxidoreductase subunit L [Tepidisphaeraceae bacterium]